MRLCFVHHGFIVSSDPTSRHVEEPGRADLKVVGNGRGVMVEVKFGWSKFDFSGWPQNQREWSEKYCEGSPFNTEYWIALTIPTYGPFKELSKVRQAYSWLIPKSRFLEVEEIMSRYQRSIPAQASKGHLRPIQDFKLDAVNLFSSHKLTWHPKGTLKKPPWYENTEEPYYQQCMWTIPESHEFYRKFIAGVLYAA